MNIPDNLKYTKEHEWVKIENNIITVGITDHTQGELGDIIFIEFPNKDQSVLKDEPFGTIEAVKTVADLFAPISGKIIEINDSLEDSPELVNSDAYGEGWIVKISEFNEKDIKPDYKFYITNQIKKPVQQIYCLDFFKTIQRIVSTVIHPYDLIVRLNGNWNTNRTGNNNKDTKLQQDKIEIKIYDEDIFIHYLCNSISQYIL